MSLFAALPGARRAIGLLAALMLAACTTLPSVPPPARDELGDFILEARFALALRPPEAAPQSAGGRLSWEHRGDGERILIANPLGIGIAEIETTPSLSRLRAADGTLREAADADELMAAVTGERLPVARLPAWLLGRGDAASAVERDEQGRPARLAEAGWQIDYAYDDDAPDALPARITLRRAEAVELRLRVEEWRGIP
ncbi:MAG: lipoprotein insertase outer membrane protein LolB [Betaproteobacteria bacterium]|nr:lipoprotein insertase outer membrane protein LolB [Betaproteobacteria bacterium]MCL2885765.1 lipoprotein insertase outer membrane protein LolB [Betaproteobacteria bacterium]